MTTTLERHEVPVAVIPGENREYLTFRIDEQLFGIPVLAVRDVLDRQNVTPVSLAPSEVAGVLNLRGHIVTAIDMRRILGLGQRVSEREDKGIVVDHDGDLYNLVVDSVEDVLMLSDDTFEHSMATMDAKWQMVSKGVHRLDESLLVVLDVPKLLETLN